LTMYTLRSYTIMLLEKDIYSLQETWE
jgi:hypothetical protein